MVETNKHETMAWCDSASPLSSTVLLSGFAVQCADCNADKSACSKWSDSADHGLSQRFGGRLPSHFRSPDLTCEGCLVRVPRPLRPLAPSQQLRSRTLTHHAVPSWPLAESQGRTRDMRDFVCHAHCGQRHRASNFAAGRITHHARPLVATG